MPTDHIQAKPRDLELSNSITSGMLRDREISTLIVGVGEASALAEACHR